MQAFSRTHLLAKKTCPEVADVLVISDQASNQHLKRLGEEWRLQSSMGKHVVQEMRRQTAEIAAVGFRQSSCVELSASTSSKDGSIGDFMVANSNRVVRSLFNSMGSFAACRCHRNFVGDADRHACLGPGQQCRVGASWAVQPSFAVEIEQTDMLWGCYGELRIYVHLEATSSMAIKVPFPLWATCQPSSAWQRC